MARQKKRDTCLRLDVSGEMISAAEKEEKEISVSGIYADFLFFLEHFYSCLIRKVFGAEHLLLRF